MKSVLLPPIVPKREDAWHVDLSNLMLVLDVDGVTRHSVEDVADTEVVAAVRELLKAGLKKIVFLSGSPAVVDPRWRQEAWCKPNKPLAEVFAGCFDKELATGQVGIEGQAGAERISLGADGQYVSTRRMALTQLQRHEICIQLLLNFVDLLQRLQTDDKHSGILEQIATAIEELGNKADAQSETGDEDAEHHARFEPVVALIRQLVPSMTLVSLSAMVETTMDLTEEQARSLDIVAIQEGVRRRIANIADPVVKAFIPNCFAGLAHRGQNHMLFAFCMMTDKGTAVDGLIREQQQLTSASENPVRVITVGDTAMDFKMHAISDWSFHVGKAIVLRKQRQMCAEGEAPALAEGYQHVTFIPKKKKMTAAAEDNTTSPVEEQKADAHEEEEESPSHCGGTVRLLKSLLHQQSDEIQSLRSVLSKR